jgi:hypothetical protein
MQTRHRIPTIFNLSMVDVLCCALGCIILLWLVYFKEARERATAAGKSAKELTATKARLQSVMAELTSTQQSLLAGQQQHAYLSGQLMEALNTQEQWKSKAAQTEAAYKTALLDLKLAQAQAASLKHSLNDLRALDAAVAASLKDKTKDYNLLAGQLIIAANMIRDLEKQLGDQKGQLAGATDKAADLQAQLKAAQEKATKLEQQLATMKVKSKESAEQLALAEARATVLKLDLDKRKLELTDSSKRYDELLTLKMLLDQNLASAKGDLAAKDKDLMAAKSNLTARDKEVAALKSDLNAKTKELATANLNGAGLVGENKVLSQRIRDLEAAAEKRFAGIELTGKKVVFLVDMSGSMRSKDNYTEDPDKWPMICEIFGKLMMSLADLKQFQVIMFSDGIRYPLGGKGKWFDFKGPDTVKQVVAALKANTPDGGTNMSLAFEEVFRYRAQGLDTIYFFSDGLPNQGEGLPANSAKLTEDQKGAYLGKYIRDKLKTRWNVPQGPKKERVRINAVGFYFDSPDVGAFLWTLARENDGSFVGMSKP